MFSIFHKFSKELTDLPSFSNILSSTVVPVGELINIERHSVSLVLQIFIHRSRHVAWNEFVCVFSFRRLRIEWTFAWEKVAHTLYLESAK